MVEGERSEILNVVRKPMCPKWSYRGLTNEDSSLGTGSSAIAAFLISDVGQRAGQVLNARSCLAPVTVEKKDWLDLEFSVFGTGADDERRYVVAVMGTSKRVTNSGTWCLSNSDMAASSSCPLIPAAKNSAIFAQRFISFGSTSLTLRFSPVPPFLP